MKLTNEEKYKEYILEKYRNKRVNRNTKKHGYSYKKQIWVEGKGLINLPLKINLENCDNSAIFAQ